MKNKGALYSWRHLRFDQMQRDISAPPESPEGPRLGTHHRTNCSDKQVVLPFKWHWVFWHLWRQLPGFAAVPIRNDLPLQGTLSDILIPALDRMHYYEAEVLMTLGTQDVWLHLTTQIFIAWTKGPWRLPSLILSIKEKTRAQREASTSKWQSPHGIEEFWLCVLGYPAPPLPGAPVPVCPEVQHRRGLGSVQHSNRGLGSANSLLSPPVWAPRPSFHPGVSPTTPTVSQWAPRPPLTPSLAATFVTTSSGLLF